MPGFDGTGPLGRGPMTGWRRGWCMPAGAPVSQQETADAGTTETQTGTGQPGGPVYYGLGRGGVPYGCGRGFGGGMRGRRCGGMRWRF